MLKGNLRGSTPFTSLERFQRMNYILLVLDGVFAAFETIHSFFGKSHIALEDIGLHSRFVS